MSLARLAKDAARRLQDADFVHVVSDNDADGIAAGAIAGLALHRAGIPYTVRCAGRPESAHWKELERANHILFLDMGSGQIDRIESLPGHAVILDHHQAGREARTATQVNPNLVGEDGTTGCCASTLAFLFALGLDDGNVDLGGIALGGIVGDRQHVPELRGENARVLQRLVKAGVVVVEPGLPFDPSAPLENALAASAEPYLVGVSGRARAARAFLEGLGITPGATLASLDDATRERFASAVVLHLLEHGVAPEVAREAVRPRLRIQRPVALEAGELSDILNACGRLDRAGVGVAAASGDADAMAEARGFLRSYNERVLKGLLKLEASPPKRMKAVQVFDAPDPELAGTHCGLGIAYLFPKDVPAIAAARFQDRVKFSTRGTMALVAAGLDLATGCRVAAAEAGGEGGGHPVASGASVPASKRDAFITRLDEIVAGQMGPPEAA